MSAWLFVWLQFHLDPTAEIKSKAKETHHVAMEVCEGGELKRRGGYRFVLVPVLSKSPLTSPKCVSRFAAIIAYLICKLLGHLNVKRNCYQDFQIFCAILITFS